MTLGQRSWNCSRVSELAHACVNVEDPGREPERAGALKSGADRADARSDGIPEMRNSSGGRCRGAAVSREARSLRSERRVLDGERAGGKSVGACGMAKAITDQDS